MRILFSFLIIFLSVSSRAAINSIFRGMADPNCTFELKPIDIKHVAVALTQAAQQSGEGYIALERWFITEIDAARINPDQIEDMTHIKTEMVKSNVIPFDPYKPYYLHDFLVKFKGQPWRRVTMQVPAVFTGFYPEEPIHLFFSQLPLAPIQDLQTAVDRVAMKAGLDDVARFARIRDAIKNEFSRNKSLWEPEKMHSIIWAYSESGVFSYNNQEYFVHTFRITKTDGTYQYMNVHEEHDLVYGNPGHK
jgi:hypothetical protein